MKKRRILRPCFEKVLLVVFAIDFVLLGSLNDFEFSLRGLLGIGILVASFATSGYILSKYGRFFNSCVE